MDSPADNYWPEPCASCKGTGKYQFNPNALRAWHSESVAQLITDGSPNCVVCGGKALVLVLQPARKCRHCGGTGRSLAMRCPHCEGTGWMFVQKEHAGFLR